jgi:hypothetical protein
MAMAESAGPPAAVGAASKSVRPRTSSPTNPYNPFVMSMVKDIEGFGHADGHVA